MPLCARWPVCAGVCALACVRWPVCAGLCSQVGSLAYEFPEYVECDAQTQSAMPTHMGLIEKAMRSLHREMHQEGGHSPFSSRGPSPAVTLRGVSWNGGGWNFGGGNGGGSTSLGGGEGGGVSSLFWGGGGTSTATGPVLKPPEGWRPGDEPTGSPGRPKRRAAAEKEDEGDADQSAPRGGGSSGYGGGYGGGGSKGRGGGGGAVAGAGAVANRSGGGSGGGGSGGGGASPASGIGDEGDERGTPGHAARGPAGGRTSPQTSPAASVGRVTAAAAQASLTASAPPASPASPASPDSVIPSAKAVRVERALVPRGDGSATADGGMAPSPRGAYTASTASGKAEGKATMAINGAIISAPPGPFRVMLCLANLPCLSIAEEPPAPAKKTVRMQME